MVVSADSEGGGADARGRQLLWLCHLTLKEGVQMPGGGSYCGCAS